jgi:hypothetical protein
MFFLVFWLQKRVGPMWPTLWELGLKDRMNLSSWKLFLLKFEKIDFSFLVLESISKVLQIHGLYMLKGTCHKILHFFVLINQIRNQYFCTGADCLLIFVDYLCVKI